MFQKVRFLKKKEIVDFQKLVKNNYPKKNHIFEKNTKVINYYYNFFKNKNLNILGLFCSNKLVAAQGLITMDNWDKKIKKHFYLAFTVKSKKYKKDCMILFLRYIYNLKPVFLGTIGVDMSTAGMVLNRISKFKNLDHYYIANPLIKKKILKDLLIKKKKNINQDISMLINKIILKIPKCNFSPQKTKNYFINKYLKNPFYEYYLMKFSRKDKLLFFFVFREITIKHLNTKIIRAVDFYGHIPKNVQISDLIIKYLVENNIEYIDLMVSGMGQKIIKNIGFYKKTKSIKIPNHFKPFDLKANFLNYGIFINKYKKKTLVFNGDGDQDRP